MPRKNTIAQLPDSLRAEVNKRLRKAHYLDQISVREWLLAEGYEISKSALSRYVKALRSSDGTEHKRSHELAAQEVFKSGLSRKESILMELGELRLREIELIDELREISG